MTSTATELLPALDFARENGSDGLLHAQTVLDSLLQNMGASVQLEPFSSSPHRLLAASVCLVVVAVGLVLGSARCHLRWTILQIAGLGVAVVFLTGGFDVLLPHVTATNVLVEVAAGSVETQRVMLAAHYDSKTEPFDYVVRTVLLIGLLVLLPLALVAQHRARHRWWRWCVTLPAGVLILLLAGQGLAPLWMKQRSHGIRDNATACALLAELCSRALHRPLEHTRLQFAWWAGEEIASQGSHAWVQQHAGNLPDIVVNLELIGAGADLAVGRLEWTERGFRRPDAVLLQWLEQAQATRPLPLLTPLVTDAGPFLASGVRAVTLLNVPATSRWPRGIHSAADGLSSMNPEGLERTREAILALLRHLDSPTTAPGASKADSNAKPRVGR